MDRGFLIFVFPQSFICFVKELNDLSAIALHFRTLASNTKPESP